MRKYNWIDGLKGLAICGVVMIHTGGGDLPGIFGKIGCIGKNGVQLFFIISAFLTFCSLEKLLKNQKFDFKTLLFWYLKKFIRLIPLYYIALILHIIMGGSAYWLGSIGHITIGNIITHLFFIHGFFPHYVDSIIGVEWYIGVLSVFYIISPFLYKILNNIYRSITFFVFSLFFYFLYEFIIYKFVNYSYDSEIFKTYFLCFSVIPQLSVIALGIVLFYLIKYINNKYTCKDKYVVSYSLLFMSLFLIYGIMYGYTNIYGFSSFTLFGIVFFILCISQSIQSSFFINNVIFNYLGKNSYSIYLFHFFILSVYSKILRMFNIVISNDFLEWIVKYLFVMCVSSVVSYFVVKFVDKPVTSFLTKKVNELKNK